MHTITPTLVDQNKVDIVFELLRLLGHSIVQDQQDGKYRILTEGGTYKKAYDGLDKLLEDTFDHYVSLGIITKGAS